MNTSPRAHSRPAAVAVAAALLITLAAAARSLAEDAPRRPFRIEVVDAATGRGVPLVELETVDAVRFLTDSNGLVALDEPGLYGRRVFFNVRSHGYEMAADGFGMRGKALDVEAGGRARVEIRRVNVAERLYRITGAGIYRDTVLLGERAPIREPLLNGLVAGQDSVFCVVHRGRIWWFWGDTSRPAYPLGNFHTSGATSRLPSDGGLDPDVGIDLEYFIDADGFSRPMARMPGDGVTWIDAVVTLPAGAEDGSPAAAGAERLYCAYAKVRSGTLATHARGIARLDDDKAAFEHVAELPLDAPAFPSGHAFKHAIGGVEWVYFAAPYPLTRTRANAAAYRDAAAYEAFTCLAPGSRRDKPRIERDESGAPRWAWKRNAPPLGPAEERKLVESGELAAGAALLLLREADSGKPFLAHAASVAWNPHRERWTMVVCEQYGTSYLGETWYAEADTPLGPWVYARKVVTHERYSFYNPDQHPMLAKAGGRFIYFEGTYTHTFSGNAERTPRYDYNQVLYRLDLDDERLVLPVPVYEIAAAAGAAPSTWATAARARQLDGRKTIAFFALDRPRAGAVPVFLARDDRGGPRLELAAPSGESRRVAFFWALPPGAEDAPAPTVPLWEFTAAPGSGGGGRIYSTATEIPGRSRAAEPLCRVWRNPLGAALGERLVEELEAGR